MPSHRTGYDKSQRLAVTLGTSAIRRRLRAELPRIGVTFCMLASNPASILDQIVVRVGIRPGEGRRRDLLS